MRKIQINEDVHLRLISYLFKWLARKHLISQWNSVSVNDNIEMHLEILRWKLGEPLCFLQVVLLLVWKLFEEEKEESIFQQWNVCR